MKYNKIKTSSKIMNLGLDESYRLNVKSSCIKVMVCTVDKALAEEWLKVNNTNRKVSAAAYARYAKDMINDTWLFNGEPVRFDWDGNLCDGQHRLLAIILADSVQQLLVVTGLDPKVFLVTDTGKPKTRVDAVHMLGHDESSKIAGVVTLCYTYKEEESKFVPESKARLTNMEVADFLIENPEIVDSSNRIAELIKNAKTQFVQPSIVGACHWAFAKKDADLADRFMERFITGVNVSIDDPLLSLRNKLIELRRKKVKPYAGVIIAALVRVWNYERNGVRPSYIKLEPNYKMEGIE